MPARRVDWERVREEYVAGADDQTLEVLAHKYGTSWNTARKRAAHEKWTEQRAQYRHMVATRTREKASTKEAEIRARQIERARLMSDLAHARFALTFKRARENPAALMAEMDVDQARLLAKDAADIERRAAGIPDESRVEHNGRLVLRWPEADVPDGNGGGNGNGDS